MILGPCPAGPRYSGILDLIHRHPNPKIELAEFSFGTAGVILSSWAIKKQTPTKIAESHGVPDRTPFTQDCAPGWPRSLVCLPCWESTLSTFWRSRSLKRFSKVSFQDSFYQWMFLVHLVLGVLIILPFVVFGFWHLKRSWSHPNRRAVKAGMGLFIASLLLLISGVLLTRIEGILEIRSPPGEPSSMPLMLPHRWLQLALCSSQACRSTDPLGSQLSLEFRRTLVRSPDARLASVLGPTRNDACGRRPVF